MKKRILGILTAMVLCLTLLPTAALGADPAEQFTTLTPGGTYWFDLSGADIPGTVNEGNFRGAAAVPDKTLHWVPFTYAGTVDAYTRTEAGVSTEGFVTPYVHSLFIADYNVTHTVSWDTLNGKNLIFGTAYTSGGVDYTLRAPSAGSNYTGSDDSERGTPQSNEWDKILDKDSGYIKNWSDIYSWGQDTATTDASFRAVRGYNSARRWTWGGSSYRNAFLGFRPVLEVLNPDTLGSDGLKVVTLDLGGGKLGNSSKDIQIIVKTGSEFTAPASDGLNRPAGDTGSYFVWLGSNGKLYAPGDNVPADVTKLTAQFTLSEQFSLTPGGRYYFDLSGEKIPGTANGNLPDSALHYVPFTYAGTIEAYKLTSAMATTEEYAQQNKYAHSLFVADYNVTHTVSWNDLNTANLIFGKGYVAGGVDYTLRAPSVGSYSTGSDDSERGMPQSNEWNKILDKDDEYIQNWNAMFSCGQDVFSRGTTHRAYRGYFSARYWDYSIATTQNASLGFRPVLEVLNPDTLGSDGLKVVTLDLNGGTLGGSSDAIQIIVKNGSEFTAPASDGLTRPTGNTGTYFKWQDSSGNRYEPGDTVPAGVTSLTARWEKQVPTVNANDITVTYTGSAVPASAITGTASVDGTWKFKNTTPVNVADSDNVTVVFTPTDTANYETVEDTIKVTINKATPTGTPAYTAITTGGKTLADAALTVGTITPDGGSIAWDAAPDTAVTANTAYNWIYTPADTDNYNNLTGSITPYVVSYSGGSTPTYPPTVEQPDEGGTVTVSPKNPEKGDEVTITPKPDEGYEVEQILVTDKNGNAVEVTNNGDGTYSFTQPAGKVNVKVTFMDDNTMLNFFVDVFPGDYYYDAVLWAAEKGITGGVDDTHFAPNAPCTRAQIVTFLWRAAGSPVVNYAMNFSDVPADAYYAEAVRWAVGQGITTGTGNGIFSPDANCTRAQAMTFIYRSVQAQGGGMQGAWMFRNPFSDVDPENYYGEAVMWAVANGVTSGTSDTTFSPGTDCTRAQTVTFLFRCLAGE